MGGLVATHLARWKHLDFLCADRTFESIFKVADYTAGRLLGMCLRFITAWDNRVVSDYLESSCYKIITFDPRDEVIPFLCSLQHGVTVKTIQAKLDILVNEPSKPIEKELYRIFSPYRYVVWVQKLIYCIKMEIIAYQVESRLRGWSILSQDQATAVFKAFERVFELFETFSLSQDNFSPVNRQLKSLKAPFNRVSPPKNAQTAKNRGGSLVFPVIEESDDSELSELSMSSPTTRKDYSFFSWSPDEIIEETPKRQKCPEPEISYKKSIDQIPYKDLFDKEAQHNMSFMLFLGQVNRHSQSDLYWI